MGRGSTDTFGGGAMPKIYSVEAWDGKDGQVSGSIAVVSCSIVSLFCSEVQHHGAISVKTFNYSS